jgi:hypothetical protein
MKPSEGTAMTDLRFATSLVALAALAAGCQGAPAATPVPIAAEELAVLAPPPAGEGVQLTLGPFPVAPGAEVQNNFFLKLPVDEDVMVKRIQIAYPKGSHHLNLFKSDTKDVPDHVEDTFAAMYPEYDMFANSQSGDLDWKLPEGVGMKFRARQQLMIQSHYVNTLTQATPGNKGQVKVNLWFAKPGELKQTLGMFFAVNPSLRLPPHSTWVAQKAVSLSDHGYNETVNVVAMSGHFHSRGKTFEVNRWSGRDPNVRGEELYRSDDWDEPPMKFYDQPIQWRKNERFLYTGTYVNPTDIFIGFGAGNVDTKEHSNLFVYFYPGPEDGRTIYDVEASQFQEVDEI